MPRLIWVFAGRTVILLVLSWCSSYATQIHVESWRKQICTVLAATILNQHPIHVVNNTIKISKNDYLWEFINLSLLLLTQPLILETIALPLTGQLWTVYTDRLSCMITCYNSKFCATARQIQQNYPRNRFSSDVAQRGDSNDYPQHMFLWRTVDNYALLIINYPPHLFQWIIWAKSRENLTLGFLTMWDSNRPAQLHRLARSLKFWI